MRSITTRIAVLGIAGVIAAGAIAPASAAARAKRAPAPAQSEFIDQSTQVSARPQVYGPQGIWRSQNDCVSDEGYGRYSSCDQGGF